MTAFRFSREFEVRMLARCDVLMARVDTELGAWADANRLPVPAPSPAPAGRHRR